jgi:hypothetical protein
MIYCINYFMLVVVMAKFLDIPFSRRWDTKKWKKKGKEKRTKNVIKEEKKNYFMVENKMNKKEKRNEFFMIFSWYVWKYTGAY